MWVQEDNVAGNAGFCIGVGTVNVSSVYQESSQP